VKTFRILLLDSTDDVRLLLERQIQGSGSPKFDVYGPGLKFDPDDPDLTGQKWDTVLFGQNIPAATISQLTKLIRGQLPSIPVLMLTKQSEASVPASLKKCGVDDVLNLAEISTPLFSWVLESTLEQIKAVKKVSEFDTIIDRLQKVDEHLALLQHELNNPLGVIKLAIYHLENPALPEKKKDDFFRLLVQSVDKIEAQIGNLNEIRKQLGHSPSILPNILKMDSPLRVRAGT